METDIPFVFHETDTRGIGYVDLFFDVSTLTQSELPAAAILIKALGMMDTDKHSYQEFAHEVNRTIGGLMTQLDARADIPRADKGIILPAAEVRMKGFYDQLGAGFDLIGEMLTATHLRDEKRLREILAEIVSSMQMRILMAGHTLAAVRSLAYGSVLQNFKDQTDGIAFYRALSGLYEDFDNRKDGLMDQLESVAAKIFAGDRMTVSYTGERDSLSEVMTLTEMLARELPGAAPFEGGWTRSRRVGTDWLTPPEGNEAFMTAGQVQFLARSGNYIRDGYQYTGALMVLSTYLRWEYLWQNVRVKGGAYGCMTSFGKTGGSFFVSYRDPNLKRTWDVFSDLPEEIRNLELTEREMRQYIIGAINMIDQPLSPHAKGSRSMNLYLSGIEEEALREERRQILEATSQDLNELADLVEDVLDQDCACVIGSEAKIKEEGYLFDSQEALH